MSWITNQKHKLKLIDQGTTRVKFSYHVKNIWWSTQLFNQEAIIIKDIGAFVYALKFEPIITSPSIYNHLQFLTEYPFHIDYFNVWEEEPLSDKYIIELD